ncbi:hypothetical protein EUTSA_v10014976mg [Eutrema salsugineum]|uniref:RNA polymerase Rpb4/RPC9 core domain-containing protein n=1 Tax=Eutrema salsugineum TaxID=72664 RepID=V4LB78_EUTSA|nr:hypothetical protein EUTSA_v10014976mg [Eutrema salsugineum]
MSGEEEENAAELKIGDEFLKAKCLMNCEVSLILEHKYEQLQQVSEDPMNQVSQVFEKSLQYVKRFSRYKNPDAVRQVREYPLCKISSFVVLTNGCFDMLASLFERPNIMRISMVLQHLHLFLALNDESEFTIVGLIL